MCCAKPDGTLLINIFLNKKCVKILSAPMLWLSCTVSVVSKALILQVNQYDRAKIEVMSENSEILCKLHLVSIFNGAISLPVDDQMTSYKMAAGISRNPTTLRLWKNTSLIFIITYPERPMSQDYLKTSDIWMTYASVFNRPHNVDDGGI